MGVRSVVMATLAITLLVSLLAAPAGDCRRECEAIEAETDRQTCLLQCDQKDSPGDGTGTTRWRREERLGGAPPGSKHEHEGGTTTTVETTRRDGTTSTETTTTKKSGQVVTSGTPTTTARPPANTPRNMSAAGPWLVLAKCQTTCDADRNAPSRAKCKLVCLDASPGLVKRRR